jgi:hypothetical protein
MKPSLCTPPPQELSKAFQRDQERHLKHPGSVDLIDTKQNKTKQTNYLASIVLFCYPHIYEARFVCFVPMRSTEPGCFRLHSSSLWKALEEEGCMAWFHGVGTCCVEVLEY